MGAFGERLRREREMRGITLSEMAAATKIGTRNLSAIEEEKFDRLPGGIFNKGFVRAYARFLGINEDQAVSDYLAAVGEPEHKTSDIDVAQLVAQHESEKQFNRNSKKAKELGSINDSRSGFPWAALLGLAIVVAGVAGGWSLYQRYKAGQPVQATLPEPTTQSGASAMHSEPAVQSAPTITSASATISSSGSGKRDVPAPPEDRVKASQQPAQSSLASPGTDTRASNSAAGKDGFIVSIRATQDAWVSITADGNSIMVGTMHPSDEKSIRAHKEIVLKTGNAGGMELAFNGKPLDPLGGPNEVRRVTINSDGSLQ